MGPKLNLRITHTRGRRRTVQLIPEVTVVVTVVVMNDVEAVDVVVLVVAVVEVMVGEYTVFVVVAKAVVHEVVTDVDVDVTITVLVVVVVTRAAEGKEAPHGTGAPLLSVKTIALPFIAQLPRLRLLVSPV